MRPRSPRSASPPKQPSTGRFAFLYVPRFPLSSDPRWSRNPIDAFIAAEHEEARTDASAGGGQADADSPRLSRSDRPASDAGGSARSSWPTRIRQAYEKIVDRLLASPQYGERWGRHWLDIWRYSDWYGYRASEPGPLFAAAHLALARLDHRVAEPEQAVRRR